MAGSVLPYNSLVWLKQPDYPWWPGMVLDPESYEVELPPGRDTCVLCFPSSSSSIAFASSGDAQEVMVFDPDRDDQKPLLHPDDEICLSAVAEALQILESQRAGATAASGHADAAEGTSEQPPAQGKGKRQSESKHEKRARASLSSSEDDDNDSTHRARRGSRSLKKDRKREKKKKSRDSHGGDDEDGARTARRHERKRTPSHSAAGMKGASDGDEAPLRRDREAQGENGSGTSRSRREKGVSVEARDGRGDVVPLSGSDGEPAASGGARQKEPATDEMLRECECRITAALLRDCEEELLEQLAVLARVTVTYEQLAIIKIGVSVGKLMRSPYVRVQTLATAILNFWFQQLPCERKSSLARESEIDLASIDSVIDGEPVQVMATLGAVGVQIESFFTEEEITDSTSESDAAIVAKIIEDALEDQNEDVRLSIFSALQNPANSSLRRLLLRGEVSVTELLKHSSDPMALIGKDSHLLGRPSLPAAAEPEVPVSPTLDGSALENFSTLYTCPNCNAKEATINKYSVQSHDNLSVLAKCLKCGETWKIEA